MKVAYTERFKKSYKSLHPDDRERVSEAIELFMGRQHNRGLNVEKLKGLKNTFSFRASRKIRIIFEKEKDVAVLLDVNYHRYDHIR